MTFHIPYGQQHLIFWYNVVVEFKTSQHIPTGQFKCIWPDLYQKDQLSIWQQTTGFMVTHTWVVIMMNLSGISLERRSKKILLPGEMALTQRKRHISANPIVHFYRIWGWDLKCMFFCFQFFLILLLGAYSDPLKLVFMFFTFFINDISCMELVGFQMELCFVV